MDEFAPFAIHLPLYEVAKDEPVKRRGRRLELLANKLGVLLNDTPISADDVPPDIILLLNP